MTLGGTWAPERAEAQASLVFYQGQALAAVLMDLGEWTGWMRRIRDSITSELAARQSDEGAWQGLAPDSCEDEPLLATAFALRSLASLA